MIEIFGREIGAGKRPFIVAEAGVHHKNSLDLALEYVRAAADSGADAIKFQTYDASKLTARWAPTYWAGEEGETQFDVYKTRSGLKRGDYQRLMEEAAKQGIGLLSTPFDEEAADMLRDLGMEAFKVASADLTHHLLLQHIAGYGRPVLMSTGAATILEIRDAYKLLVARGVSVVLLHCNLAYPTPIEDANLMGIPVLRQEFPDAVIGYSDHVPPQDSEISCPLAVALGAALIEKHFTLDKTLTEDDHFHAVDPAGLVRLVKACRQASAMTIPFRERPESEIPGRRFARRSLMASRELKAGHVLHAEDISCKRPGTGLPPHRMPDVIGRRLKKDLAYDDLIRIEDLAESGNQ